MYRWDFDGLAQQQFAALSPLGQAELTAFMNAAILVDPMEASVTKAWSPFWSTLRMTSFSSSGCVTASHVT